MIRGERRQRLINDDNALIKQIKATHSPDGRDFDCKPVFRMSEEIFNLAMAEAKQIGGTNVETEDTAANELENPQQDRDSELNEDLAFIIDTLYLEIANPDGVDGHSKAVSILKILRSFSWEAKLALSLAAVALKYGEFLLLTKVYLSDKLPKPMAILKGMADISEFSDVLKPRLSKLNELIISMLDLAKCIVELTELLSKSHLSDVPPFSIAIDHIIVATYWTIRGGIVFVSNIAPIDSLGLEGIFSATELWELSAIRHKIETIKEPAQNQLASCHNYIEERKQRDAYDTLVFIIEMQHIDNLKVLRALLCAKEDEPPLYDGSSKTMVNIDVLREKNVLLLISGLDVAQDEDITVLRHIFDESRTHETSVANEYELVWIPIVDPSEKWTPDMEKMLESNRTMMPWYSLNHPQVIAPTVLKLFKERFHYQGRTILVALEPHGKVVNTNAIDMIWLWGNHAFPFSQAREEALWKEEILGLELIVDGLHPEIENWVKEEKYVIVYGGDDKEWIRNFVTITHQVMQAANIPLEMVYVGMSGKKEQDMIKLINIIRNEKLSHFLPDTNMIWLFWKRVDHMMRSKIRQGSTIGEDSVLQSIAKLLSHDQSGRWASLFKSKQLVVIGHGDSMDLTMRWYLEAYHENADKGFDVAFKECFENPKDVDIPPLRIIIPNTFEAKNIRSVLCSECNRHMEEYIMFRCTHGML
ncbi:hypothetical protein DH2020_007065 [Rehmannia glutinosa]|uniref:Uncharacterized protein n=1 Tax=Rehmannia glutinosa TaxID=99300 RepID=A0ABR0TXH6_REHGL